jgi:hypothetical protein
MKSILLFLIVGLFSLLTTQAQISGQNYLEQEERIKEIETQLQNLRTDLQKFNKQYRTGTALLIGGFAISSFGIIGNTLDSDNSEIATTLPIIGGIATLAGIFLQVDAHKFLGGMGSTFIGGGKAGVRIKL